MKSQARGFFESRAGFILACIGSAVGIGNVWLFPWRVGEFGGAIFLLLYFFFIISLGVIGLIGEFTLGRMYGTGPVGSFEQALQTKKIPWGAWVGAIPMLGALGIATGYAVVVGWILRFLWGSIDGSLMNEDPGVYFGAIVGDFGSLSWHTMAIAGTVGILLAGVSKGIEQANKIMMPLFYILFILLLLRVFTLPNIKEGLNYLLIPKWEILQNPKVWAIALGQALFSLSLAGSGMVVYGSYLKKGVNIVDVALQTAIFSSIGALLCALVVILSVFSFGLDPTAGPPLVFITLPLVFQQMPFGQIFAILFFLSVFFAAVTSLINLMECPIEALQNRFNVSRFIAVIGVGTFMLVVGVFLENADNVGAWMDLISIYIVPLGATLSGIIIYWVLGKAYYTKEIAYGNPKALPIWFHPLAKYFFVGIMIFVLILSACFKAI